MLWKCIVIGEQKPDALVIQMLSPVGVSPFFLQKGERVKEESSPGTSVAVQFETSE